MRHESTRVPRDRSLVLADADPTSEAVHHPTADYGAVALKVWDRAEGLIDARLVAVRTLRLEFDLPVADDLHVPAFATLDRLADERIDLRLRERRQEIGALGE